MIQCTMSVHCCRFYPPRTRETHLGSRRWDHDRVSHSVKRSSFNFCSEHFGLAHRNSPCPRSVAVRPERGARRGHRGRVRGRSERRDRNQRRQRESSDKRFHVTSPCLNMSSSDATLDAFCIAAMSPPIFFVSPVSTCLRHAPKTAKRARRW